MKIVILAIGKTDNKSIATEINHYVKRISYYLPFSFEIIPDIKNRKKLTESLQKTKEGELILDKLINGDYVILLDEAGTMPTSKEFALYINKKMNIVSKRIVFIIGGPYGFSEEIKNRANDKISLSRMTFTHQMVRLLFAEQFYRAMTILNNEPYHHE